MNYLSVNVNNELKEFVEQLLQKLGCEVTEEAREKETKRKPSKVSPIMLFDKWKDIAIDPENFRKNLWGISK